MYEAYFGFREKPFNLTPDPKFLYLSQRHHEAFAHLAFGLEQRGGFMVVTGEVGTGKTTLCRYFLERLDEDTVSAFILYPALTAIELLRSVNRDLGIPSEGDSEKALVDTLHQFLLEAHQRGKNVVLVIDEAQNLSRDVLEQVRLISNLETNTEKLIQIVLIGQSELNDMLAQRDLRQLAQRVTARYHLTPLSRDEVKKYVHHRLAVAGRVGAVGFAPGALRAIHEYSNGVPRLINLACDRTLLAGYVLEEKHLSADVARKALKELEPPKSTANRREGLSWLKTALVATLVVVIGLLSLAGFVFAKGELPWGIGPRTLWKSGSLGEAPVLERSSRSGMSVEPIREQFELRLVTLSEELSRRASSAVLLDRWGIKLGGGVSGIASLENMAALAERAALEYTELETSFEQLRALNVPAVIEVTHPSRERVLFLTLTGLHGDDAVVYFAPGDFFELPVSVIEHYWNGRARVFWRDFDNLELRDDPGRLAWARARLTTLGIVDPDLEPADEAITEAIVALQQRIRLDPTGGLTPETRMALYSLGGEYRTPQLMNP